MHDCEPISNVEYGISKPMFTGITPLGISMKPIDQWRNNMIPYFGLLTTRYNRGMLDAYDIISDRYVRMKGVVWPDEFKNFNKIFFEKHPEAGRSRYINDDNRKFLGAYWNDRHKTSGTLFGRNGLFNEFPILSPKPKERDAVFLKMVLKNIKLTIRGKEDDEYNKNRELRRR